MAGTPEITTRQALKIIPKELRREQKKLLEAEAGIMTGPVAGLQTVLQPIHPTPATSISGFELY